MLKAYLYPRLKITRDEYSNPYLGLFLNSLKAHYAFVNENDWSNIGILHLMKYIFKIDCLFLSFPEDMADRKFGVFQSLFFVVVIVPLCKITNVKIIWTLHNNRSHYHNHKRLKNFLFGFLIRVSNIIITHAREGIKLVAEINLKYEKKVFYFPHPVTPISSLSGQNYVIKYDFIIWGTITWYKGVDAFLEYLHLNGLQHRYKTLIAGKTSCGALKKKIERFCNESIRLIDEYIEQDQLDEYILYSRAILFTYNDESVLSSGALAASLNYNKTIIGPYKGAFRDLAEKGLILTYRDFAEIQALDINSVNKNKLGEFIKETSWEKFAESLVKKLEIH